MGPAHANQPQKPVQIDNFERSARKVHTITDRFSMANTYLINDGQALIIVDPGSERNVLMIRDYLQIFLQRQMTEIDLIVLTHLHSDHTAGVHSLLKYCHAPVAASAVIKQLAQRRSSLEHAFFPTMTHVAEHLIKDNIHHLDLFQPDYRQRMQTINIWLEDVSGLPGHPDWRVITSPGHTPDSLCLYNPFSYELLCGDTVITIEGGAPLLRGGTNRRQLNETMHILRSLPTHYLYPGHGRAIIAQSPLTNISVEW